MKAKRKRVLPNDNAAFDKGMSSHCVDISEGGMVATSGDNGHSHSLVSQCLNHGVWSWMIALDREDHCDETTCIGVAVHPVTNSNYENSHQMWMVRCYNGETYCCGGVQNLSTCKIHPLDRVVFTLDSKTHTLYLEVNEVN
ncbi:unnamed protein product, partial [Choristocarpus tenellus]